MEEERSRLQEVIGKMEARLGEQSRLLEQVGTISPPGSQARQLQLDFPLDCLSAPSCFRRGSHLQNCPRPAPACPSL